MNRKISPLRFAMVLIMAVYSFGAYFLSPIQVHAANVVQNPGFETAGGSASDAANWTEGSLHARASDKFNTGAWSLKSTFRGAGTDTRQTVSISTSTTYTYSGYIWRTNTVGGACMDMNDIVGELTLCSSTVGSWQFKSGTWGSGSNTSVTLRLITDASPTGDIWFDDISLDSGTGPTNTPTNTTAPTNTPTDTPIGPTNTPTNTPVGPTNTPTNTPVSSGNVIQNSGFETAGGGGAADAANWTEWTNQVRASDKFNTGAWSLKSTVTTNGATSQGVSVVASTAYTFSGYAWKTNTVGNACIDMADLVGEVQRCTTTAGSWVFLTGAWNSGATTSLTVRAYVDGNPTGAIWFDDITLTGPGGPTNTPTNTPTRTNTPTPGPSPTSGGAPNGTPRVIIPQFATKDIVVASWVVTDPPYNADNTGVNDATSAIQSAIQAAENAGGGVVWMPAGKYKVTGSIHIYNHVTLRGDWRDPDVGSGSYGTVIMASPATGADSNPGLFRIWGSAGVKGLTVFYPNQTMPTPLQYPYTFEILGRYLGEDGYIAGSVQDVTLLNSYKGISAGKDNTHELHALRNVKGTPLALGIYLQDTADVGKVERIKFDGTYWANLDASVSGTKPTLSAINTWTRANGIGLQIGGVEWDQLTQIYLSDYKTGVTFVAGRRINTTAMFYDLTVLNSNVAFNAAFLDGRIATVISNCTLKANQGSNPIALKVVDNGGTSLLFNTCTIGGGASKAVEVTGNTMVNFQNTTFDSWTGTYGITTSAGSFVAEGCNFAGVSGTTKGINLQTGTSSSVVLQSSYPAGQSANLMFNNGAAIADPTTTGNFRRQDTGYSFATHGQGAYPWRSTIPHPANNNLYNVRAAPYNAVADGVTDATTPIQNALNDAGAAGGGTVFVPAGIYKINTHLTVPAGVELRGAEDVPHRVERNTQNGGPAMGTIFYAVENKGVANPDTATPFIMLNGNNAGVRGFSVHYPSQNTSLPLATYPWTIRGSGTNVYAYDLSFTNAYKGIDFATNPTNGHYINQVTGLALKEGIRVGNASEGWMEDNLFNINAWARAYGLPGILTELPCCNTTMWTVADAFTKVNLQAFIVGNGASNEHVLSNFVYGAWGGHTFEGSAQAVAFNIAADGSLDEIRVTGTGAGGVKIINSEGCGNCGGAGAGVALKVTGGTARVWNLSTMETYAQAVNVSTGTVVLQGAAFHHSLSTIGGGNVSFNGVLFRDSGTDVTINGGTVNLWGNIGGGGFNWTGTPASASNNIPR